MTRYAIVRNARDESHLGAYLPSNYRVIGSITDSDGRPALVIAGEDSAGWTLEGYVIPRLASGLIWAEETLLESDESILRGFGARTKGES